MWIKTSELISPVLDWAVAKALNLNLIKNPFRFSHGSESGWWIDKGIAFQKIGPRGFHPSTNWSQGGPIIEQEKIEFSWEDKQTICTARVEISPQGMACAEGSTPLIAAMRCLVASKLGEEIEVPE